MNEVIQEIKKQSVGRIEENVSLKKYNTYKIDGIVRCIVFPKNIEKLVFLMRLIKSKNIQYKVIGNGSNLLFSSQDYNGILIKLSEFTDIEISENKIKVGAGFSLIKLTRIAAKRSLTGLEFASGIPGTIGGAIFMNAGAYKSDMGYIVKSIKVLTPDYRIIELENKELNFHYRTSFLKNHPDYICLEAVIKLSYGKKEAIENLMKSRLKRRLDSQPLNYPSAGSVFRNPKEMFSGELIEKSGLKGTTIGGAMVSEKHANFIINKDHATGEEIKALIEKVQQKVKEDYNIDLIVEQEFVNF